MPQKVRKIMDDSETYPSGPAGAPSGVLDKGSADLKNFSIRLKRRRKDLGLSQKHLSDAIGISTKTIQKYEYGDIPKGTNLLSLARVLNCSMDWLLMGPEPGISDSGLESAYYATGSELTMIPKVLARLNAGGGSLETSKHVKGMQGFRHDWIKQKGDPSRMILMDVSGDSMSPEIKDGDTVLIDQGQTDIYIGKIYAVSIGQEITVKYVERVPEKIILRSANRLWSDIEVDIRGDLGETVNIIGRVLWWCREAR
jgi:phage repressor protein C with HTH and peptisase S24 domain